MRVLRSFNMSLGVNLMKQIVKMCARNLNDLADIEIVEFHHNKKKRHSFGYRFDTRSLN